MMRGFYKRVIGGIVFLMAFAGITAILTGDTAKAVGLIELDSGYTISNFQMTNDSSMWQSDVQSFLEAKVTCEEGATCLAEELFGDGETLGEGESAAWIISVAGWDYNINPQVLIAMLQKESGLVTNPHPTAEDYRLAMGYECPDGANCEEDYYGFKNQVRRTAVLLQSIVADGSESYPVNADFYNIFENWFGNITKSPKAELVSVSQYGVEIEPVWDEYLYDSDKQEFGRYYYPIANNSDDVTVGVRVSGMGENETYSLYRENLTAEDNDRIVYVDVSPSVYMGDSGDEANEYCFSFSFYRSSPSIPYESYGSIKSILRPVAVGSSNIEIVSVKQNGTDVYFDKVGRQVKDLSVPQTINEYQLTDYNTPVTLTIKFKNLMDDWYYSYGIGGVWRNFTADADEEVVTVEVPVETFYKHTRVDISMNGNGNGMLGSGYIYSSTTLYFRVTSEDFVSFGNMILDQVQQNGVVLEPEVDETGYRKTYTFEANDVQNLAVTVHATNAVDGMYYYLMPVLEMTTSSYINYNGEQIRVTGAQLKEGVTLTMPARYGESDSSPFELRLRFNTTGSTSSSGRMIFYGEREYYYVEDNIYVNFYEDENIPREEDVDYDYAIYQDKNELTANANDIYVISNYTKPIYMKLNINDGDTEDYCVVTTYTSLDSTGGVIEDEFANRYGGSSCSDEWRYDSGKQIYLNASAKTTRATFKIYDKAENEYGSMVQNKKLAEFSLDFAYEDYDKDHIPSIELVEVRQGGKVVVPSEDEYSGDIMIFKLNTIEDYEYKVKGYNLLDGIEYNTYYQSNENVYDKNDLENGATIHADAYSYFNFPLNGNYSAVFGYNSGYLPYGNRKARFEFDSSLNEGKAVYDMCVKYKNEDGCIATGSPWARILNQEYNGIVDYENYDAENDPVVLYLKGNNYDDNKDYNVNVTIKYLGETVREDEFLVRGEALNSGVSKEYFGELNFVTFNSLFNGSFGEGGYNVSVTIGTMIKSTEFMANGGASVMREIFSSEGLDFASYLYNDGGGIGSAGGNMFVGNYNFNLAKEIIGDHAYLYLGKLVGDIDTANYHLYRCDDYYSRNLSEATLVKAGTVNKTSEVGLIRIDGDENGYLHYVLVVEKNGRIIEVTYYNITPDDETQANVGFSAGLKAENNAIVKVTSGYTNSSYKIQGEESVKVVAYGARLNKEENYTVEVSVNSDGRKTFGDTFEAQASDFNGETTMATIPYESLFYNSSNYSNITVRLKNSTGEVIASRTVYLTKTGNFDVMNDDVYGEIRTLEGNGDDDPNGGGGQGNNQDERIDDQTGGDAEYELEDGVLTIDSEDACTVLLYDGENYTRVNAGDAGNGKHSFAVGTDSNASIIIRKKGNLNDGDQIINMLDANVIYRSLLVGSPAYLELTPLQLALADLNGDGVVNMLDANVIYRSLLVGSPAYAEIGW